MEITKEVWKEMLNVLNKHNISFTARFASRDIQKSMKEPDVVVQDKHIQINLVIPDYFDDNI